MISKTGMRLVMSDLKDIQMNLKTIVDFNHDGLSKPELTNLSKAEREVELIYNNMMIRFQCIFKEDYEEF